MVTYPITIYFDGSCKLCSSEINNLVARDKHSAILLVDCSPVDFDDRGLPANRESMTNMIHARDATGEWLRGVDVFIAAYRAADLNFVSRMLAHRWIKPLAMRAYPWVVRNRFRLSRLGLPRLMNWLTPSPQLTDQTRSKTAFARSQTCAIERHARDGFSGNTLGCEISDEDKR
jgi:predicted DCC family thiol-disulfide oxidoreductase YuxK